MRAAETAVVWDAHLGGYPVCLIGIESIVSEPKTRRMTFELKAASQPEPITYAVKSDDVERTIQIERVEWTPEATPRRGRRAEEVLQ